VYRFCPTRYAEEEKLFGEWAYRTSIVNWAGTARKSTFCPLTGPADSTEDSEFVSSPYTQLRQALNNMHRDRPFAKREPGTSWWHLIKFDRDTFIGEDIPRAKTCYLMLGILLREARWTRNRETRTSADKVTEFFNPEYLGKGLGPDDAKLTVMAVTQQGWIDIASGLNANDGDGEPVYPDPCNPDKLAVFYLWNHVKAAAAVPTVVKNKDISGVTGAVAGVYYRPNHVIAGKKFALPRKYVNADGTPTDAYFEKVPIHIGDTIQYMSAEEQVKHLAKLYADARDVLRIAFNGTEFSDYLESEEAERYFARTPQKYVYDSSVHEGAPVSVSVKKPAAMAAQQEEDEPEAEEEEAPFKAPPKPAKPTAAAAAKEPVATPLPTADEVYMDNDGSGYAVDADNDEILHPETGERILAQDLLRKIEMQNWNA
jgi:hypothetical protein